MKFRTMMRAISFFLVLILLCFISFAQEKYVVSAKSNIKVTGTSTLHDWEVLSNEISGSLLFELKDKGKKNQPLKGSIASAELSLKVESLKSERGETMNGKMHRALLYDEFPQIKFSLTEAIPVNEASTIAKGVLAIAGTEKSVQIGVDLDVSEDTILIQGSKNFKLSDFEIDPPSAMFGQIETGNDIVISFDLKYTKE
ncbi:YceI family protein [Reichenbachiella sp. MALMAid0571]|uniref:YceI family protein n=1 Tax=Reichenbachiella sp. MALMAid0571 TaxID=3143939 RepID=UPI0032E03223